MFGKYHIISYLIHFNKLGRRDCKDGTRKEKKWGGSLPIPSTSVYEFHVVEIK
jgi:hypothetical protein